MCLLTKRIWRVFSSVFVFSLFLFPTISFIPLVEPSPNVLSGNLQHSVYRWYIYDVDNGSHSSIGIDSSSFPHISYHAGESGGLRYASWESGAWLISLVDDSDGAGHISSLVLNDTDTPSIAYWNAYPHSDENALMWALWNGTDWIFEKLEDTTLGSAQMSLALGSEEMPKISYRKRPSLNDSHHLWFAKLEGNGTWNLTLLDSSGNFRYTSLSIDWRDWYHISYEDLDANDLRYAYWNGSAWKIEKADTEGDVGSWTSIRVDKNGTPHIGYYDNGRKKLKYATKLNVAWNTTLIDDTNGPGISLDLDSSGHPHISYPSRDYNVKHAWWNGSAWLNETVDNSSIIGELSSMRIDDRDEIHISYWDRTRMIVKYATTKELPTGEIVTSLDIDPDTLNLKSKGKFITAYIELEGADVRDINASSILLNDALSPILDAKYGFVTSEDSYIVDNDQDGITERMVKFDRSEVQKLLTPNEEVVMTVSGSLYNGAEFEGSDTIRVIDSR